jgi:hypothetical protein
MIRFSFIIFCQEMWQIPYKATYLKSLVTMKFILHIACISIIILTIPGIVRAQDFEIRLVTNTFGYIEVQMRETSGAGTPTTSTDIMDIQFELRWDQSYSPDLDVSLLCSDYNLVDGLSARETEDNFYWRVIAADSVPFQPQANWVEDQWESIGRFKAVEPNLEDTADFAVAGSDWVIQGLNINIDGTDYSIEPGDSITDYIYPTKVFDYVWTGGAAPESGYDQSSWTYGPNWVNECGQVYDASSAPVATSNCCIPGGLTYYPVNFNNSATGNCNDLRMQNDAYLEVPPGITLNVLGRATLLPGAEMEVKNGGIINLDNP